MSYSDSDVHDLAILFLKDKSLNIDDETIETFCKNYDNVFYKIRLGLNKIGQADYEQAGAEALARLDKDATCTP